MMTNDMMKVCSIKLRKLVTIFHFKILFLKFRSVCVNTFYCCMFFKQLSNSTVSHTHICAAQSFCAFPIEKSY